MPTTQPDQTIFARTLFSTLKAIFIDHWAWTLAIMIMVFIGMLIPKTRR